MLPNLAAPGGVRLLVRVSDSPAARSLLTDPIPTGHLPTEAHTEAEKLSPNREAPQTVFALFLIFVGIVAGVSLCLFCQWYGQRGTKTHYHYTREGRADEAWVYQDGHLVESMRDRNLDGRWDRWTYYEHGQVTRVEDDNNFDGTPDETWTYSNGVVIKMEEDSDFNGTPDLFCTYKNGLVQQIDSMPNGAKFASVRELYQNGVLVEVLRGGNAAGDFKESVRYDPFLNPISTNKLP